MRDYITRQVQELVRRRGTRDPFSLCRQLDLLLLYHPLGPKLKGYFFYQSRGGVVVINQELDEELQRVVCAHELGHALLHRDLAAGNALREFTLFSQTARPELEANYFAAELLIPDEEALPLLEECPVEEAACRLCVPPPLLDLKVRLLEKKGFALHPALGARGDFLKS